MLVSDTSAIRELDRLTIASGTPSLTLMERAAEGLLEAALQMLENIPQPKVLVVCGKGNNGGDGLALARLLLARGISTSTLLLFKPSCYTQDALTNLKKLEHCFVQPLDGTRSEHWPDFNSFDLIVDAIFGTGFSGSLNGLPRLCIERINASRALVLAADTPSGTNCDSGEASDCAVLADVTVTFGLPKIGQLFYPARAHVGDLRVKDIGLSTKQTVSLCGSFELITASTAKAGILERKGFEHKNSCGRVLVVAGSTGMTGAACLTAHAALRSGAGMVTLCVPDSLNPIFEAKLTEEMTLPLPDNKKGFLTAKHEKKILSILNTYDAVVIGPGLGKNQSTQSLIRGLVRKSPIPVILDADGLNAFEGRTGQLASCKSQILLTPHDGEFRRLTRCEVVPTQGLDRINLVRRKARCLKTGLILKGPSTLVTFSPEKTYINTTGNPGMATAGAGDVLSGLIAGLFVQIHDLEKAARAAVYLHGLSGDAAALELTENALIASDLIQYLPQAFKEVLS